MPPKPRHGDAILATVSGLHKPGEVVTLVMVTRVAGISHRKAGRVRSWARAAGCWPYLDGTVAWPGWRATAHDRVPDHPRPV